MKIALVAGEASGDMLGAGLIREITRIAPDATFEGIAGPRMRAEGASSFYDMDAISIMGVDGLLRNLKKILTIRNGLYEHFIKTRPDVFVGIDVPDFNLGLEYRLHRAGIPTVHYVSPTVWAWRRYRIRKIRRAVDHMLTLFPFEASFYREHGVPVTFVGHPLADSVHRVGVSVARERLALEPGSRIVALLPGSRHSEIERLAMPFAGAARRLQDRGESLHFIVPCASDGIRGRLDAIFSRTLDHSSFTLIDGNAQLALQAADVALLASGTAALEAALSCTPMVVAYRVSALSYILVRMFSTVKYYSMPNHLLDTPMVPEFIQGAATAENLAAALAGFLDHPQRCERMRRSLAGIRESLAVGADARAARVVVAMVGCSG